MTLRCEDLAGLLLPALRGGLRAEDAAAVELHVRDCPSCAHDLPELGAVWRLLDAWPDEEPPGGLAERLREELRSPGR